MNKTAGRRIDSKASVFLLLIFSTLVSACAIRPRIIQHPHREGDALWMAYRSMREPLKAFKAEVRVFQKGSLGRGRASAFVFVQRPDRIRVDVLSPLGVMAVLAVDGPSLMLADLRRNVRYEGPSCPANLVRLLGLPLGSRELADLMIGLPMPMPATKRELEVTRRGSYVWTSYSQTGLRQELEFSVPDEDLALPPERQHLRIVRAEEIDPTGRPLRRMRFSEHRVVVDPLDAQKRGVALPFAIDLEDLRRRATLKLRLQWATINEKESDEVFHPQEYSRLRRIEARCGH